MNPPLAEREHSGTEVRPSLRSRRSPICPVHSVHRRSVGWWSTVVLSKGEWLAVQGRQGNRTYSHRGSMGHRPWV